MKKFKEKQIVGETTMSKIKLKDILAEAFEDTPTTDRRQTIESVKNFSVVGKFQ